MASSLVKTGKIDVNRFNDPIQDSKPSMEILDQTNARLAQLGSDKKMKYNLGQASGDPILLSVYNRPGLGGLITIISLYSNLSSKIVFFIFFFIFSLTRC